MKMANYISPFFLVKYNKKMNKIEFKKLIENNPLDAYKRKKELSLIQKIKLAILLRNLAHYTYGGKYEHILAGKAGKRISC